MTTTPQPPSVSRPALRFAVGVFISAALLAALFVYLKISFWDVLDKIGDHPLGILAVIAVHLFALIAKVRRWSLLLRGSDCALPEGEQTDKDSALRFLARDAVFLGWLGNLVLPAKTGEMVRPLLYSRRARMPFTRIFGTVVLERSIDLLVLAAAFWAAVAFLPSADPLPSKTYCKITISE